MGDHLHEGGDLNRHNLGLGLRLNGTHMHPGGPECRLTKPILLQHGDVLTLIRASVVELPTHDDVDECRRGPGAEEHVLRGQGPLLQGPAHELVHGRGGGAPHLLKERQTPEARKGHLVLHLVAELLGEELQDPEPRLGDHDVALAASVVCVTQDAEEELPVDAVLAEVPPQEPELLRLVVGEVLDLRHGGGDAADEGRENDEPEDQASDRESALEKVAGLHLHARGGELRQGPVKARGVPVAQGLAPEATILNPVWKSEVHRKDAYAVPSCSKDVVHHEERQEELRYVHSDEHHL
mmetsp:Transcript_141801/g.440885  ORF Transcript_141801/g.440885 Transcript_141801/m.440885 type:complete len:296 (-) Transcript_141801:803-1690(-)